MRFVPDSLAGRMSWMLIAGFVLTAAVTYVVSEWGDTSRVLNRIAIVATLVNRLPPDSRPALIASATGGGEAYAWPAPPPPTLRRDFMSHHLARDIRVALANPEFSVVDAAYLNTANGDAGAMSPPAAILVWVRLEDRSWLQVAVETQRVGALWTIRMLFTLAVLVTGLVLLALWAARKVTAPLTRFAGAARDLGMDVNASPMNESGPSEILAATQAFNQMQKRIRRFVEERTLMLAAISHDLRTALTRLKLRAESIADEEQRGKVVADLQQMDAMLSATLSFARDESNHEPATRLDLAVLLQSLCDEASDSGQTVNYQGPPHLTFRGHPIALRRLFGNVIDNAVKYGGEANVFLSALANAVEVRIEDCGPGIAPELRERVFAPFFRVEPSRSRETGGTGLGLTVARTLVRHHGGDIAPEDGSPGGLRVRISLPVGIDRVRPLQETPMVSR